MSYILHICSWYPNNQDPQNGVFIRQHISALTADFKALIICNTPQNTTEINVKNHTTTINLNTKKTGLSKINAAYKQIKTWKKVFGKPQAIHLHVIFPLFPIALLAKMLNPRCKLIISEHWTGYRKGEFEKLSAIKKALVRRLCSLCEYFIVVSKALKQDIEALQIIQTKKIHIVPNPISLYKAEASLTLNKDVIKMLSVADFNEKNKNYLGILKAFESACQMCHNLAWYIIGDGGDKAKFENALEKTSVKDKVHLLGRLPQNQVHSIMPQCQFFVNFSRFETFAMAPAEAILSGIPAIATKCGGPEFYINQSNGILIDSEDEIALSKAIYTLYNEHKTFTAETLMTSLSKEFTTKHFTETITALYNG